VWLKKDIVPRSPAPDFAIVAQDRSIRLHPQKAPDSNPLQKYD
jgi:hypothetical protein